MKYYSTGISIILLLAVATVGYSQKKIAKEFSGVKDINLNTASGNCTVKKSDGDKVTLTLEYTYDDDDYEPVIEQNGSKLVLKEVFHGHRASGNASWYLNVPDGTDLRFNTGSGDFEASDVAIEIDMNTGSGNLILETVKGNIKANTGSGNIKLRKYDGELRANTGSGDVNVADGKGEIKVNCGSGRIRMEDVSGMISANVGSGDIDVRNITVTDVSAFNSGSGNVQIVLAATPDADLSVNSGSGDSSVDFNGNALAGTLVMTANKKHGKISAPVKFDKEEEIEEGNQTYIKKTAELSSKDVKIKIGTGSGTASLSK